MRRAAQFVHSKRRACRNKKAHLSRSGAEDHMNRLIREGAEPYTLSVYRCLSCGRYHVGHLGTPGRAR